MSLHNNNKKNNDHYFGRLNKSTLESIIVDIVKN